MSITDELREYIGLGDGTVQCAIRAIADRIDDEHERMHEALTIGMQPMTEENMARDGWVKLPVDADGVPIHVGDELTDEKDRPVKVRVLKLRENGWLFDSSRDGGGMLTTLFHHVQPDSWERIIGDAQEYVTDDEPLYSVSELVERCRRLAGEA